MRTARSAICSASVGVLPKCFELFVRPRRGIEEYTTDNGVFCASVNQVQCHMPPDVPDYVFTVTIALDDPAIQDCMRYGVSYFHCHLTCAIPPGQAIKSNLVFLSIRRKFNINIECATTGPARKDAILSRG
jgi:hypothetical protein